MPLTPLPLRAVITYPFRSLILLGLAALACRAETLSSTDAQAMLRRAQLANVPVGAFRSESTRKTKQATVTTTTLTRRSPNGSAFSRTETVTVHDGHPERTRKTLTIVNAEGRWRIIGQKAILLPPPFDIGKFVDLMNRAALGNSGTQPVAAEAHDKEAEFARRAINLGSHILFAGERVTEGDRQLVRVTRTYDEQAQEFYTELADNAYQELKKQLSFVKRVAVSAMLATQGGIEAMLPAREVFTIDEAANKVIKTETYNAKGKLMSSHGEAKSPEKIADLPDETFALPAGVETIRPKTFIEAQELVEKLDTEQKKASKVES